MSAAIAELESLRDQLAGELAAVGIVLARLKGRSASSAPAVPPPEPASVMAAPTPEPEPEPTAPNDDEPTADNDDIAIPEGMKRTGTLIKFLELTSNREPFTVRDLFERMESTEQTVRNIIGRLIEAKWVEIVGEGNPTKGGGTIFQRIDVQPATRKYETRPRARRTDGMPINPLRIPASDGPPKDRDLASIDYLKTRK